MTVEQGIFAGMPTPLYPASPSRLLAWLDCPRRYRMQYLDRPKPEARPQRAHTSVGIVTHNVLRDFWDLPGSQRTPSGVAELVGSVKYPGPAAFAADTDRHRNPPGWFAPPRLFGFEFARPRPLPFRPLPGKTFFFPVAGVIIAAPERTGGTGVEAGPPVSQARTPVPPEGTGKDTTR